MFCTSSTKPSCKREKDVRRWEILNRIGRCRRSRQTDDDGGDGDNDNDDDDNNNTDNDNDVEQHEQVSCSNVFVVFKWEKIVLVLLQINQTRKIN